jgi:hypothetical protein
MKVISYLYLIPIYPSHVDWLAKELNADLNLQTKPDLLLD